MEIKVVKSRRKTLSLYIDEFGNLTVKAPQNLPNDKIYEFVKSKEDWIKKHQQNALNFNNLYSDVINKKKGMIFNKIVDFGANFKNTLIDISSYYLPKRLSELANKFSFNYNGVKIKNYKSRWGACDKKNNIYLNYKLVMLDKNLIDYVLIHELCHTKFFSHNNDFHNLLKSFFNNEFSLRKRLKNFSNICKIQY
jgi:predicted metal-dependent hydrolase